MNNENLKESVSAVFTYENQVFGIKRPAHLAVFPGYFATPGGKVDAVDFQGEELPDFFSATRPELMRALIREVREELGVDLLSLYQQEKIHFISYFGEAITPIFNPYRFRNTYIRIDLKEKVDFILDQNEVDFGEWGSPSEFIAKFDQALLLAVPPAIRILKQLELSKSFQGPIDFSSPQDFEKEVPEIESLKGVKQFLPLSHTFPPANRTNSYLIGDQDSLKVLIDPSPMPSEWEKYLTTISKYPIDAIFITHHHPDHYELADELARLKKLPMLMSEITYKRILKKKGDEFFAGINIQLVKEGDVLTTSLGQDVLVYAVPGHDDGQLALAPKNLNWFLVGDLIQTIGTVVIGDDEGNMAEYFKTLNRVIELNPKYLIPSHGIIIGGTHKLKQTLMHRQMREDEILSLVNRQKSLADILDTIYQGLNPKLLPYAKKTIIAHLDKLVLEKKIDKNQISY